MESFLEITRQKLENIKSLKKCKVHIIIGNEACDLDSAVSALIYAFYLYWLHKKNADSLSEQMNEDDIFLPVLNIKRQDLSLKTEVVYFLRKENVPLNIVFCRDDIDIETLLSIYNGRLILVDHHILNTIDKNLASHVKKIFDHRLKDTSSWNYDDSISTTIELVGSCSTLICNEIMNITDNHDFLRENRNASRLLYGTILLDTGNFSPLANIAHPMDHKMCAFLESILAIDDVDNYRKQLYNELLKSKNDHSGLSTVQFLQRDLKVVNNIPIPALPILIKNYLKREDCMEALKLFCLNNNFSMMLLMGKEIENDNFYRDLALYSVGESATNNHMQMLISSLLSESNPSLNLQEVPCDVENIRLFSQLNTQATRKKILPVVKKCSKE